MKTTPHKHLSKDPILKNIIEKSDIVVLQKRPHIYLNLMRGIVSQQLSTKVATVIYNRFLDLFPSQPPQLKHIINTDVTTLKSIGLSTSKANYILNIAQFFIDNKLTDAHFETLSSQQIKELLIQIKGVGNWTIEMLLMFSLAKEDVFPEGDLGIQTTMIELYKIKHTDKKKIKEAMNKIAQQWHPYQTYACLYLWRHKDKIK